MSLTSYRAAPPRVNSSIFGEARPLIVVSASASPSRAGCATPRQCVFSVASTETALPNRQTATLEGYMQRFRNGIATMFLAKRRIVVRRAFPLLKRLGCRFASSLKTWQ